MDACLHMHGDGILMCVFTCTMMAGWMNGGCLHMHDNGWMDGACLHMHDDGCVDGRLCMHDRWMDVFACIMMPPLGLLI